MNRRVTEFTFRNVTHLPEVGTEVGHRNRLFFWSFTSLPSLPTLFAYLAICVCFTYRLTYVISVSYI